MTYSIPLRRTGHAFLAQFDEGLRQVIAAQDAIEQYSPDNVPDHSNLLRPELTVRRRNTEFSFTPRVGSTYLGRCFRFTI